MVNLKSIINIIIITSIIGCNNNKLNDSTIKSSIIDSVSPKNNSLINSEDCKAKIKDDDYLKLNIITLIEVFGEHIKFHKLNEKSVSIFDIDGWTFGYIPNMKMLLLSSKCMSTNRISENFKLVKKVKWLEEALIHKDYYYTTGKYIIVYDYLNYSNIKTSNGDCPHYNRTKNLLDKIRIFKTEDYFEILNRSNVNVAWLALREKDTIRN